MTWTRFVDMHSGGGRKEPWEYIYIEAKEPEAISVFYSRFGHNPRRVTCTCRGEDYSISESDTLERATAYERGCAYGVEDYEERPSDTRPYHTLEEWLPEVCVIRAQDIRPAERKETVPRQGYVWQD